MSEIDICKIKDLCERACIRWTNHAFLMMMQRDISREDIRRGIVEGEVIEQYPMDFPNPSCLILGNGLHIVCGINEEEIHIITAYRPDPGKWSESLRERKQGK